MLEFIQIYIIPFYLHLQNKIMTKRITLLTIVMFLMTGVFAQGYKITIKIKGAKPNSTYRLANNYADKNQLQDSAKADKNGVIVFENKLKKLPNGIYLVVTPSSNYFEMVVSQTDQNFTMETDTLFDTEKFVIKNSLENSAFFEFNIFAGQKSLEYEGIKTRLMVARNKKDSVALQKQFQALDSQIQAKRQEIANRNPAMFISKVFRSFRELEEPVPVRNPDGSLQDSNYRYNYYKDHYWDNIDLSEDGLLRTPVYHNKLKTFMTRTFAQIPDSIIKEADKLIKKIERGGANELFRYTVMWITNHYEDSKIVCMDKVLHYMGTNYYCAGKTPWADTSTVRKICDHVVKIRPTLCEAQAPPIINLFDSTYNKQIDLYSINSPFTVVIFWDHQCGHCQKTMPRLNTLYDSLNKIGIKFEVYSVYTQDDWEGWKKYLREKRLKYINVGNMYGKSNYRKDYFFISTPQIYILDKDKRIKLKNIDIDEIARILELLTIESREEAKKKKN